MWIIKSKINKTKINSKYNSYKIMYKKEKKNKKWENDFFKWRKKE
jgi:hypothetical protein